MFHFVKRSTQKCKTSWKRPRTKRRRWLHFERLENRLALSLMLDLDANDSSGALAADFRTKFLKEPVRVADVDAIITGAAGPTLTSLTVKLTNPLDGAS